MKTYYDSFVLCKSNHNTYIIPHTVMKSRYTNVKYRCEISWYFSVHCLPQSLRNYKEEAKIKPSEKALAMPGQWRDVSRIQGSWGDWGDKIPMRKTTRLKSGWGFGQTNSPLSTARVLIDAVGLCLLRVSEVWRLFVPDLRRWISSFSGSDFKPRLVYKIWYFCYFFTNFDQHVKFEGHTALKIV